MPSIYKFSLLASLYIAQGLPFGFFTQSLPVLLRDQGMSLEIIGFSAVLVLPWALKFLWAPILDKWGSRRFWILLTNISAVTMMLFLSMQPLETLVEDQVALLLGSFFLMNLFSATQDIATDGLAVNQLSEQERGLGNGIQVAGYRVGMILGGGLLLAWFSLLGWRYSLWILAGTLTLATLPILFFSEKDHVEEQEQLALSDFLDFFRQPGITFWLVVVTVYKFGDQFAGTMVRPLLIDIEFGIENIALLLGTVGFAAGLLGALVGGILVNYVGRFYSLFVFSLLQSLLLAAWGLVAMGWTNTLGLYLVSAAEHFTGGLATAALFTVMMDHCRKHCAGSDFTIQACIVVLVSMLAAGLSGVSAATIGYPLHFIVASGLGLLALPLIYRYRATLFIFSEK